MWGAEETKEHVRIIHTFIFDIYSFSPCMICLTFASKCLCFRDRDGSEWKNQKWRLRATTRDVRLMSVLFKHVSASMSTTLAVLKHSWSPHPPHSDCPIIHSDSTQQLPKPRSFHISQSTYPPSFLRPSAAMAVAYGIDLYNLWLRLYSSGCILQDACRCVY